MTHLVQNVSNLGHFHCFYEDSSSRYTPYFLNVKLWTCRVGIWVHPQIFVASVRTGLDRYSGNYGRHRRKLSEKMSFGPLAQPNCISCISLCRAVDGLESYGKSADDINKRSSMVKSVWGRVLPMLQTVPEAPIFKTFFSRGEKLIQNRARCARNYWFQHYRSYGR
jgi:hypothetical protein